MNRIAKLLCFGALLTLTFVIALAETPRAEAHPHCTLEQIDACNDSCAQYGCLGQCIRDCMCAC